MQSFSLNSQDRLLTYQVLNSAVPRSTLLIASINIVSTPPRHSLPPPLPQCLKITKKVALEFSKTRQKLITFGIFSKLWATQNVNVARFARNVE